MFETAKEIKRMIVKSYKEGHRTLSEDNKHVVRLRKIEKAFKKAYKIRVEVRYINAKHKESMTGSKTKAGYHRASDSLIIVFVCGNKRKDDTTLFHELTHAFQNQKMKEQYRESKRQYIAGITTYTTCWHERHARHCADLLAKTYDLTLDLKNAFDYTVIS